jgi:hypothetical protein
MSLSVWPVCVIGRMHVVRRACGGHRFVAPHIFVAFGVAQTFMTRAARCCGGLYSSCTPVEIHHTTTSLFSLLAALLPMQRRPAWLRWDDESRSRDGQLGHWALHESLLSFGCTWSDRYVDENAGARGKGQVVLPTVHTCASPGPPASTLYLCTCIDPSRCSLKSIREPKAPLYWLSMPMYGCPSAHLCPVPITSLQNQG